MREVGAIWGGEPMRWGIAANEYTPRLRTHDRFGNRIDEVEFHESWHRLMALASEHELHSLPWTADREGAHVARSAMYMSASQAEAGFGCPITMTFAAVPALRAQPELAQEWEPLLIARGYDAELRPAAEKRSAKCGMAMTEKQGGSDVRANTTFATPVDGGGGPGAEYTLRGHKWFCSAPMCDLFLVLAQTDDHPAQPSCFAIPRILPDGSRNVFRLQRLKDKLGNRSNASSEVEFDGTWARMVGEPGRGVPTIIEMVGHTRLDCVIGSAAGMRAAVANASWHAAHRSAFGRLLAEQPLMRNVLADLAIEAEAATALAMRLARAYDERDTQLRRLGTAVGKYWVCKRFPPHAAEALECLGGNGYVEESGMPRIYREAPRSTSCGRWRGSRPCCSHTSMRSSWRRAPTAGWTRLFAGCGRSSPIPRPSRHARGGSSSTWRSRCRARCSCATRRRRSPMPSAPPVCRVIRGSPSGHCRRAPTRPRSSRDIPRRRSPPPATIHTCSAAARSSSPGSSGSASEPASAGSSCCS